MQAIADEEGSLEVMSFISELISDPHDFSEYNRMTFLTFFPFSHLSVLHVLNFFSFSTDFLSFFPIIEEDSSYYKSSYY